MDSSCLDLSSKTTTRSRAGRSTSGDDTREQPRDEASCPVDGVTSEVMCPFSPERRALHLGPPAAVAAIAMRSTNARTPIPRLEDRARGPSCASTSHAPPWHRGSSVILVVLVRPHVRRSWIERLDESASSGSPATYEKDPRPRRRRGGPATEVLFAVRGCRPASTCLIGLSDDVPVSRSVGKCEHERRLDTLLQGPGTKVRRSAWVREGRVELPRPFGHRILSPARLPFRHSRDG
jgi:hypothetical protein